MATTYDFLKGTLFHKHKGSDISDLSDYVGSAKGTFTTAYPTTPVVGTYSFAGTDNTTVGGEVYYAGDSAYWSGSTWTRVPGRTTSYDDLKFNNTPTNPQSGFLRIYFKSIGRLFRRNSSGDESMILAEDGWQPEYPGFACDGVDDCISIADNANLNFPGTPFMQEFFVKMPSDVTTAQVIATKSTNSLSVYVQNSNIIIRKVGVDDWTYFSIANYVGKLLHIIVGWDGTNRVVYLNGQMVQSAAQSTNLIESSAFTQILGSTGSSQFFKGSIYLVRFWNLALTASEVLQLYNNGQPQNSVILSKYRGASQVNKVTGDSSIFTGGVGLWIPYNGVSITASGGKGIFTLASSGSSGIIHSGEVARGVKILKLRIKIKRISGLSNLYFGDGYTNITLNITNTEQLFEFTITTNPMAVNLYLYSSDSDGSVFEIDDVEAYQLGAVLELKGENMGHVSAIDTSGNRLHGTIYGTPALTVNPLQQKATTGVFTTNIAAGTANKDIIIPAGYYVSGITVANTLASGNLTNVQAILDPALDNITLISGKTINNGKTFTFTSLSDQTQSITNRTVRINATGNGTGGMEVMLVLNRRD